MINFLDKWYAWFKKRRLIFLFFTLATCVPFFIGILKVTVDTNIKSVIPNGERFQELNTVIENKGLNSAVVFQLSSSDFAELPKVAESFKTDLINLDTSLLVVSKGQDNGGLALVDYYLQSFPILLTDAELNKMDSLLSTVDVVSKLESVKTQMTSFGGSYFSDFYQKDPLGVSASFFEGKRQMGLNNNVFSDGQFNYSTKDSSLLLVFETTFDGIDAEKSIVLKNKIEKLISEYQDEFEVSYFGTFIISAENNRIVSSDTFLVSILSITFIILLLLLYYRSVIIPFVFIIPVVFGVLFSLGIVGLTGYSVSALSIATAAVVMGIVLDYSFHYFTHLKEVKDPFETAKSVATPLLTGSITTILAFGALTFVNSKILKDFGLIASLTLLGAALFVILYLPIILSFLNFTLKERKTIGKKWQFNILKFKPIVKGILFFSIVCFTIYFAFFVDNPKFNGDLNKISYQPEELVKLEEEMTGLNPKESQKVYLFVERNSIDDLAISVQQIQQKVESLLATQQISNSIGPSDFLFSNDYLESRAKRWNKIWSDNLNKKSFYHAADSMGFDTVFFSPFIQSTTISKNDFEWCLPIIHETPFSKFYEEKDGKFKATFVLTTPTENTESILADFGSLVNVETLNRSSMAQAIITSVKQDFNFILFTTAGIVFLVLLLIYGRIEMAILTFLPMVISWIWILAIASLLGIEFNFVNIVLTTFIFGLGDDFSIFITDGLLSKYKYNKDTLETNKVAINLSAITTIFCTGVLYFAEHPAINSIALISVIGILCILLISNIIQPLLFDFFILSRQRKGLPALSLWNVVISIFVFSYFLLGCVILHGALVTLLILPISRKLKRKSLNYLMWIFDRSLLLVSINVRKKVINKSNLDFSKPRIYIANHTSFIDIILLLSLSPKLLILVKDWVYNSPFFGTFVRYAGYLYAGDNPQKNLNRFRERLKEGYSVLIFPEGTRSKDGKIGRFHKGAFLLAEELKVDIVPIVVSGAAWGMVKNDFVLQNAIAVLHVLEPISHDDRSWGNTYQERTKSISKHFKQEGLKLTLSDDNLYNMGQKIFGKYKFKGPILEWYFRIKWNFEKKNFQNYALQLNDGSKILDIGCGYGYFSFYLKSVFPSAKITGIDYDEEKVEIAKNAIDSENDLEFISCNALAWDFGNHDYIFLNDVLHYFAKEHQEVLLEKVFNSLNEGGILFIRDGVSDQVTAHSKTVRSELFSTKLGFNKQLEDFYFPNEAEYLKFGENFNVTVEKIIQSNDLSNTLFIYKKPKIERNEV